MYITNWELQHKALKTEITVKKKLQESKMKSQANYLFQQRALAKLR